MEPDKYEEAIRMLSHRKLALQMIYKTAGRDSKDLPLFDIAIAALREKQKREKESDHA